MYTPASEVPDEVPKFDMLFKMGSPVWDATAA
jgi:hypothetical protein